MVGQNYSVNEEREALYHYLNDRERGLSITVGKPSRSSIESCLLIFRGSLCRSCWKGQTRSIRILKLIRRYISISDIIMFSKKIDPSVRQAAFCSTHANLEGSCGFSRLFHDTILNQFHILRNSEDCMSASLVLGTHIQPHVGGAHMIHRENVFDTVPLFGRAVIDTDRVTLAYRLDGCCPPKLRSRNYKLKVTSKDWARVMVEKEA